MTARKDPDKRQGRGTADIGLVPAIVSVAPPPPHPSGRKRLLVVTVKAWGEFWDSTLAGLVMPADMPALSRLFRSYDMRERYEREQRKHPFTIGSTGQDVVNPAAKEVASLDARITNLEDRFGITPMARLKLGIKFGDATSALDKLNKEFDEDEDEGGEEKDPRLRAVEGKATG